jgi:hypothetical protein
VNEPSRSLNFFQPFIQEFGRPMSIYPVVWFFMAITCFFGQPASAEPVSVRFPEGLTRGFLVVRSVAGDVIGQGELSQVVKEADLVESRLVFTFKDGSLHDEKVAFSQKRVLTLISYRLIQHGPSFPKQLNVSIDRGTSQYEVRSRAWKEEKEDVLTGEFELPKDAYNGMLITVLLNLPQRSSETVKILAFTPEPKVIDLTLRFVGEQAVRIGDLSRKALRYSFEPGIGVIQKFFGKVLGKLPQDFHYHCWILADDAPGFAHFEGPLQLLGPIIGIELVSPRLSTKSGHQKPAAPQ